MFLPGGREARSGTPGVPARPSAGAYDVICCVVFENQVNCFVISSFFDNCFIHEVRSLEGCLHFPGHDHSRNEVPRMPVILKQSSTK